MNGMSRNQGKEDVTPMQKKQPLIDYDSHNVSEDESTCVIDEE